MSKTDLSPREHLRSRVLRRALAGDAAARFQIRDHLQAGCERCLTWLSARQDPQWLEGEVERQLSSCRSLPDSEDPLPPRLSVRADARFGVASGRPRLTVEFAGVALGLALSLVLALVWLPRGEDQAGSSQTKGTLPLALQLDAALQLPDGSVSRIDEHSRVPPEGVLLLRYHATEAGTAMLLRQRGEDAPEPVKLLPLLPGQHLLMEGAATLGVPMDSERGSLTLWVVAHVGGVAPTYQEAVSTIHQRKAGGAAAAAFHVFVE